MCGLCHNTDDEWFLPLECAGRVLGWFLLLPHGKCCPTDIKTTKKKPQKEQGKGGGMSTGMRTGEKEGGKRHCFLLKYVGKGQSCLVSSLFSFWRNGNGCDRQQADVLALLPCCPSTVL